MILPHDRRGFLRGLATLPLIGGGVAAVAALAPNDARLAAIADGLAAVQVEVNTYRGDDTGFAVVDGQFSPLMREMDSTPADTLDGVLHKIRATDVPGVASDGQAHDIMCSICEDITRLHAAGLIRGASGAPLA